MRRLVSRDTLWTAAWAADRASERARAVGSGLCRRRRRRGGGVGCRYRIVGRCSRPVPVLFPSSLFPSSRLVAVPLLASALRPATGRATGAPARLPPPPAAPPVSGPQQASTVQASIDSSASVSSEQRAAPAASRGWPRGRSFSSRPARAPAFQGPCPSRFSSFSLFFHLTLFCITDMPPPAIEAIPTSRRPHRLLKGRRAGPAIQVLYEIATVNPLLTPPDSQHTQHDFEAGSQLIGRVGFLAFIAALRVSLGALKHPVHLEYSL
jgi:hypothetical protein